LAILTAGYQPRDLVRVVKYLWAQQDADALQVPTDAVATSGPWPVLRSVLAAVQPAELGPYLLQVPRLDWDSHCG
jgi:hypothetical protein